MDSLLDKYRKEELTLAELQELRGQVNGLDDAEMARMLDECDARHNDGADAFSLSGEVAERIRTRCFERAGIVSARHGVSRWFKRAAWAAAVIVPLLMLSTVYMFIESCGYKELAETDITIMTGEGERVTTVLPDGTKVELNYRSQLRYALSAFNGHERSVHFNGEEFFDVAKNGQVPFFIKAREFEVIVRGTAFNLMAREDEGYAELYLESGRVDMHSKRETVKLGAGQLAHLDYATGNIEVSDVNESRFLSWRTGDMMFHNETLDNVIKSLSANYGYEIVVVADKHDLSGAFHG